MKFYTIALLLFLFNRLAFCQQDDSVFVTFYYHPNNTPTNVYLPGEFNGWVLNSNSLMSYDANTNTYYKTIKLRVGGPNPLPAPVSVPGAYQYKFNDGAWFSDPLNPRQNPNDNNNSYLFIRNPTIHYLLPNSTTASGIIRTRFPEIKAYLFSSIDSNLDTSTIKLTVDETDYQNIGSYYDQSKKNFPLHFPILWAMDSIN